MIKRGISYFCKVKRIIVILVLLVYSSATMGATIHLHYCMNEFTGWSLLHYDEDNKCGKCGMTEKKGGCCKDEHKQIKIEADHQSSVAKSIQLVTAPALVTPFVTHIFRATSLPYCTLLLNAPPHVPKWRLHLVNCVFLI